MNLSTSERTEVDYTFKMTQADLDRYLADPQLWADDVRAQLNGTATAAEGGRSVGPDPKGTGGARGRRSSKKLSRAKPPKPSLECPVCRAPFKSPKRLSNHLAKRHPDFKPE